MTKEEAAYFAGIIDGEGSVLLIQQNRYGHRLCVCVGVSVTSTDIELLEWCKDKAGGYICSRKKQKEAWKDIWIWHVKSKKALQLLVQIIPYLVINHKRNKAQFLVNNFSNLPIGQSLTGERGVKRARLIAEFRSL